MKSTKVQCGEDNINYRKSHMSDGKGEAYHSNFNTYKWRAYLWQRERNILKHIIIKYFPDDIHLSHLDFACGTGRILSLLSDNVEKSCGIDISPSMISVCKREVPNADLVLADITENNEIFSGATFNIITAFRFFPNAEQELRLKVLQNLTSKLTNNGILVFNNHKNYGNGFYFICRMLGRHKRTLKKSDIAELVRLAGLKIIDVYPIGALPFHEKYKPLPSFICDIIDKIISIFSIAPSICQNVIYICKKVE